MKLHAFLLFAFSALFGSQTNAADIPDGWLLSGSNPTGYDFTTDASQGMPAPSGKLSSNDGANLNEFATAMQSFNRKDYLGKRLQLDATIKSNEIEGWAGLWMRVDKKEDRGVAFDNMQNRAIKGTTDWNKYSVVLDVPIDAANISFGVLMSGSGQVWFDEFTFTVVDSSVPVTDMNAIPPSSRPVNTSF